jgi:integrase
MGFPNTKIGAELAEAQHVAYTLRTGDTRQPRAAADQPAAPASATVSAMAEHVLAAGDLRNKYSTTKAKRQILRDHVEPALGALPVTLVTYAVIEDFKVALGRKSLSAKTINNVLTVLRHLLSVAKKRGELAEIPPVEWLPVEKPGFDFLDFDEAARLFTAAAKEPEWYAMIMVAARAGLRQGELLGLRWDDVDLVAGRLTIRRAIVRGKLTTTKSKKHREVALGDDLAAALKAHRHLRGLHVFCDAAGAPFTSGACKHPLWRLCRRAGLRRIGWHVLRHTFASHLVMRGAQLKAVQELMGHATIQMTMRYAHLAPHVTRDAVRLLDAGHPVPDGVTLGNTALHATARKVPT